MTQHVSPFGLLGGALRGTLPNPSLVTDEAGLAIAQQVFSPRQRRPFDPRAAANILITLDAMGATVSGVDDNASSIDAARALLPHDQRIPKVQAGTNITIVENALGPVVSSTGGGAAVDDASAIIAGAAFDPRLAPWRHTARFAADIHDSHSEYLDIAVPASPAAGGIRLHSLARRNFSVPAIVNTRGQQFDISTIPNPVYRARDDDFLGGGTATGGIGELGWILGAGTVAGKAAVTGHLGILTLLSSATSGTIGRLLSGPGTTQTSVIPQDIFYLCFVVRPVTSIASAKARFGLILTPGTSGEGSDGIYFSFDSVASTFIRTVTKAAGVGTVNTSAITWTLNNWYLLEIIKNGANYEFWINGALAFTHSTNIPTAAEAIIIASETNSAASKDIDIDYFALATIAPLAQQWT